MTESIGQSIKDIGSANTALIDQQRDSSSEMALAIHTLAASINRLAESNMKLADAYTKQIITNSY